MFRKVTLTFLTFLAAAPMARALPSSDPKFRTTVNIPDGTTAVITRDPFNPYVWYYIPPALRLATDGDGNPKFRWVEFVLDGRQHAILQFAVRGDLDQRATALCRKAAVDWFEIQRKSDPAIIVPTPNQIQLSPVGPIRGSALRSLVVRNKLIEVVGETAGGPSFIPVDPPPQNWPNVVKKDAPKDAPKDGEKKDAGTTTAPPLPVKTLGDGNAQGPTTADPGRLPGVTELTQETWLQFEISGPGVQVIKEQLTGMGQGGMILLYWGKYLAYAPEVSVHVKMNVEAVATYFRERKAETSGWSFLGLVGSSKTSVSDVIRNDQTLKRFIQVERIGGGDLTKDDWEKIEGRLYAWVTNQVFDPKSGAVTVAQGVPAKDPATGQLLNAGPLAAAAFGMPFLAGMNLSLGYQSSSSNLNVRASGTYNETAEAYWKGFDVLESDVALYGAVGLQGYDAQTQAKLIGQPLKLKNLPSLYVTFPVAENKLLSLYKGSSVAVIAPGDYKLSFNPDARQWNVLKNQSMNAQSEINGVRVYFDLGTDLTGMKAEWNLPNPNSDGNLTNPKNGGTEVQKAELKELPNYLATVTQRNGLISFGNDIFPYRPVVVDITPLTEFMGQAAPGSAVIVQATVRCELSEKEKKNQNEAWQTAKDVGYGLLPDGEKHKAERYVAGRVTGLSIQFNGQFRDAFNGIQRLNALAADEGWVKNQVARLQERKVGEKVVDPAPTTGFIAVDTAALGLHRYGLSFNRLALKKPAFATVKVTSQNNKTVEFNVTFDPMSGIKNLTNNEAIPGGVIWLTTRDWPKGVTVTVEDAAGKATKTEVPADDVKSWAEAEGTLLLK